MTGHGASIRAWQSGFTITTSSPYRPDTLLILMGHAFKAMRIIF
jgi:hypothetical protein